MLLVISEDQFEKIINSKMLEFYKAKKEQFFFQPSTSQNNSNPLPGQLKEELFVSSTDWNFASPFPCFYALTNCHKNKNKMSSISNLTPEQSYNCALKYLNKESVFVEQKRRLNKVSHTKTQTVNIHLKNNKH